MILPRTFQTSKPHTQTQIWKYVFGSGHLLVSQGKWVSGFLRFSDSRIFDVGEIICLNTVLKHRRNKEGVMGRPLTKRRVLIAIPNTLKFQFTFKCWKVDFLMSSKTRSCESSREKFRMVRALLSDTPRPHQFQPDLTFCTCYRIFGFSSFSKVH